MRPGVMELDGVATDYWSRATMVDRSKSKAIPIIHFHWGAVAAMAQASVLELYDPDRSRHVWQQTSGSQQQAHLEPFPGFRDFTFRELRNRQGDGLAMLEQLTSSPTWKRLKSGIADGSTQGRWFQYQPLHHDQEYAGSRAQPLADVLRPQYDLSQAATIVCFDADQFGSHPAHLKLARDWSSGRRSRIAVV
ncbi:MAG: hypothetical protein R3C56_34415 [Pirellulaceae bacterium]